MVNERSKVREENADELAKMVAWCRANTDLNNQEIAQRLGIEMNQFETSKKEAIEKDYLQVKEICNLPIEFGAVTRQKIFLSQELERCLREVGKIDTVHIVHVGGEVIGGGAEDIKAWDGGVEKFANRSVEIYRMYLQSARNIGVTFGRVISKIVLAISSHRRGNIKSNDFKRIFPCWASPINPSIVKDGEYLLTEISASMNAKALADQIKNSKQAYSLLGIPLVRPVNRNDREFVQTLDVLSDLCDFKEIFGQYGFDRFCEENEIECENEKGLIHEMDCLFATIGGPPWGRFFSQPILAEVGIDDEMLEDECLGDIAGVLLPKKGASDEFVEALEQMERRWTGISHEMVKACADRGFDQKDEAVGVVAACFGSGRAEATIQAVKSGLVNVLIIDSECSEKILRELRHRN